MEPISWATIITLIANVGYPLAVKLIDKWSTTKTVTPEEWIAFKKEASQMSADRMKAMLTQAGIDPASEQGKAFLALVGSS